MISKIKRFILASSFIFLAALYISCNTETKNKEENANDIELGSASFSIFVPDFNLIEEYQKASERVIPPQTASVSFSYIYDEDEIITLDPKPLSQATSSAGKSTEDGYFGVMYNFYIDGIYAGKYAAGTMKVELLDSAGNAISTGTNKSEVVVSKDTTPRTEFYTLPVSYDDNNSTLAIGEMKFFKLTLDADKNYKLDVTVEEGQTPPALVIYNEDGTYDSYKANPSVIFEKRDKARVFYIGVYAKKGACSYKSNLSYRPDNIELAETAIELDYDETYQISYTVSPTGVTPESVTYISYNPKIKVSDTGLITASSAADGYQSALIKINVDGIEKSMAVTVRRKVASISLNKNVIVAHVNGTSSIQATVLPTDATDPAVTWTIANQSIATIKNGIITGLKQGNTTVTAKAGDKTVEANIVVIQSAYPFSIIDPDDLIKLTEADSATYKDYITDATGKIAYKYTTENHKSTTGFSGSTGKWDIIGKKGDEWYSSTYNNAGWGWKINNTVVSLSSEGIAKAGDLKLQVAPFIVYSKGNPYIMLLQLLTNTGTTDLTGQKFGSGTDIEIAGNKEAPVYTRTAGASLVDNNTNMIFSLNCLTGDVVTPVDTLWIGKYSSGVMSNVYEDNQYGCTNTDSAMAYSWQNIDLAAGETKVFAVRLSLNEDEGGSLIGVIY